MTLGRASIFQCTNDRNHDKRYIRWNANIAVFIRFIIYKYSHSFHITLLSRFSRGHLSRSARTREPKIWGGERGRSGSPRKPNRNVWCNLETIQSCLVTTMQSIPSHQLHPCPKSQPPTTPRSIKRTPNYYFFSWFIHSFKFVKNQQL